MVNESKKIFPAVVIGLGAAGVGAAVYLSRMGVQPLAFETGKIGGRLIEAPRVEDYPGFSGEGKTLVAGFAQQLKENKIKVVNEAVTGLTRDKKGIFTLTTDENVYRTYAVVIATGLRYESLEIPGSEDVDDSFFSSKPVSDAEAIKGQDIVVLGGDDESLLAAEHLSHLAKSVTLAVAYKNSLAKAYAERFAAQANTEITEGIIGKVENVGSSVLVTILLNDGSVAEKPAQKLFLLPGLAQRKPNTDFLQIHEVIDDQGNIAADQFAKTFVPGLFAAGDVQQKNLKSLSTAVSDGAMAGIMAYKYVTDLKDSGKIKR